MLAALISAGRADLVMGQASIQALLDTFNGQGAARAAEELAAAVRAVFLSLSAAQEAALEEISSAYNASLFSIGVISSLCFACTLVVSSKSKPAHPATSLCSGAV